MKKNKGSEKKSGKDVCRREGKDEAFDAAFRKKSLLRIEQDINKRLLNIKRDIFEIGKLLSQASRCFMDWGHYEVWIGETFGHQLSVRSAGYYREVYEAFSHRKDIVEAYPLTYLLHLIHETPPDKSVIEEIDKAIAGSAPEERDQKLKQHRQKIQDELAEKRAKKAGEKDDQLEVFMKKYKEESHVSYYEWLVRSMIEDMKYVRRIKLHYRSFASFAHDLYNAPFYPVDTLDVLNKMRELNYIEEIDTAMKILTASKEAYLKVIEHFERGEENGRALEKVKAFASNPQ